MSMFEGLSFAACPVREGKTAETIKVAVQKGGAIKFTFNAGAYAKLGKPAALAVETARDGARHFMKLTPAAAGGGWPMLERDPPAGEGQPSGACTIHVHPFKPGVFHRAEEVEAEWWDGEGDGFVLVAMPDWKAMLDRTEEQEGETSDEAGEADEAAEG